MSRPKKGPDTVQIVKPRKGMRKGELAQLRYENSRAQEYIAGLKSNIEHIQKDHEADIAKWKGRAKLWRRLFHSLVGTPGQQPEDDTGAMTVSEATELHHCGR